MKRRSPIRLIVAVMASFGLPILLLGYVSIKSSSRALREAIVAQNLETARWAATQVESSLDSSIEIMRSLASRVETVQAVRTRDAAAVARALAPAIQNSQRFDRAFVTDPAGTLWADFPPLPGVRGTSFAYRDWYRGISRKWTPYVSEVYQRAAEPRRYVVAVAVPIRDRQDVIGILVGQYRTEHFGQWVARFKLGYSGFVYVVDQHGRLVSAPSVDPFQAPPELGTAPPVAAALRGDSGVVETLDPITHSRQIAAYAPIRSFGWGVVAQQPVAGVSGPIKRLSVWVGGIGAGLLLLTIVFGVVWARAFMRNSDLADLLEMRRAELERLNAELKIASQAKTDFLSRMSHELRTPLHAVLGFAQLLEMDSLSPEQRENVAQISKAGRHLLELINEVLDMARIEAGRLSISPEPVPLQLVVREVLDLVAPMAREGEVSLDDGTADAPDMHVLADRQRLKQVLLNLLSNAIKFNRKRGMVVVSSERTAEDKLRIKVSDTGPGIAQERMSRLFAPFERLGAEQAGVEGTGLGLALTKRLVEGMGGTLGVESAVGVGSTFWMELPLTPGPVERLEDETRDLPEPRPLEPSQIAHVILYIEDNLSNLKLIQRLLVHRPEIRILPAMQGRLGLELARQHRPQLILLDLHLPDIPGEELLRLLQEAPETRAIPVVVISADATPGQIKRMRAAGARAYLTKPLDARWFLNLLDEVLLPGRETPVTAASPPTA